MANFISYYVVFYLSQLVSHCSNTSHVLPAGCRGSKRKETMQHAQTDARKKTSETLVFFESLSGFCVSLLQHVVVTAVLHLFLPFLLQWTHKLPERTVAGMLNLMKGKEFREYVSSGSELPSKHTVADALLQAEVCTYSGSGLTRSGSNFRPEPE